MKIARETWILGAIGIADLISTIVFIRQHGAKEANPLFRHYWEMGLFNFVAAKAVMLFGPLLILEWARRSKPQLVRRSLQCAIAGYVLMYGVGVARLNSPPALAGEAARYQANNEYLPPASKEEVSDLLTKFHQGKSEPMPTQPVDDAEEDE